MFIFESVLPIIYNFNMWTSLQREIVTIFHTWYFITYFRHNYQPYFSLPHCLKHCSLEVCSHIYPPPTKFINREGNYWVMWFLLLWVKLWDYLGRTNSITINIIALQKGPYILGRIMEVMNSCEKATSHCSIGTACCM